MTTFFYPMLRTALDLIKVSAIPPAPSRFPPLWHVLAKNDPNQVPFTRNMSAKTTLVVHF